MTDAPIRQPLVDRIMRCVSGFSDLDTTDEEWTVSEAEQFALRALLEGQLRETVETRDLLKCPRCGERHAELKLHRLTNAHWTMAQRTGPDRGHGHWAWCPKTQQPIVFIPENAGQSPAA